MQKGPEIVACPLLPSNAQMGVMEPVSALEVLEPLVAEGRMKGILCVYTNNWLTFKAHLQLDSHYATVICH